MNSQAPTYLEFKAYRPGSSLTSDGYAALVGDAEAYVDEYIYPNSVDGETAEAVLTAYKKAVAAVVDFDDSFPYGSAPSAYTAGKVHETFGSGQSSDAPTREGCAREYLSGSGLLCRWL